MEPHGRPGRGQMARPTYDLLQAQFQNALLDFRWGGGRV
jgi:hypothetical protein